MMKGTRNIGRAILVLALVGAVGFSAIACKTDADGNGGDNGNGNGGNGNGPGGGGNGSGGFIYYDDGNGGWIFAGPGFGFTGSLVIPDEHEGKPVTAIWDQACTINRLTTVTIGKNVTSIGDSAFYGSDLTSVTIPNSVTSIGGDAFRDNNLTSVTIGANVNIANNSMGAYGTAFRTLYNNNGKLAGTYTYSGGSWARQD